MSSVVYFIAAFISGLSAATISTSRPADLVTIGGTKYRKEVLVDLQRGLPQDVRVDRRTGNIFFITITGDSFEHPSFTGFNHEPSFKARVIKRGSTTYQDIGGIRTDAKCVGIDQVHGAVYIGTERGLYKYEDTTTSAWNYGSLPYDIIAVDIGDNGTSIYFVEAVVEKTHKLSADFIKNEVVGGLKGAYGLTIDQENSYYFTDFYTPYVVKSQDTGTRMKITGDSEFFKVADFAVDQQGRVFAINDRGDIYSVERRSSARKLGNTGITGETTSLAVDADGNFLVGYKFGIARLTKDTLSH